MREDALISPATTGKKEMVRFKGERRGTPDSHRSFSIGSLNSMDEQVRQHLMKKSLEDNHR